MTSIDKDSAYIGHDDDDLSFVHHLSSGYTCSNTKYLQAFMIHLIFDPFND